MPIRGPDWVPIDTGTPMRTRAWFSDVALLDPETNLADEKKLIMWAREPRSLAIARQGDVAEWLHGAWQALDPIVQPASKSGGEHA
jgi:hypothetical protein